jgi:hypothetical protein
MDNKGMKEGEIVFIERSRNRESKNKLIAK